MSRGYNTRAYVSNAPGAFYVIGTADFGVQVPALVNGSLAYNAGAGSLAMGTAFVKLTWITQEGESLPSAEAQVTISAATGAFTITVPTIPTGVIGFRVYSAGTTGLEELNTAAPSSTQAQQTFVTNQGNLLGFPIADATVQILIYGTGATVPIVDRSGIQASLPVLAAAGNAGASADYFAFVPNTSSQWKVQKSVEYMKSDGLADPPGIVLSKIDCIAPAYPGVNTAVALGAVMVLNGYAFKATANGTTATTFIGFSKFNLTKGATTTDGSVTWTSFGKSAWLRFRFVNAGTPAAAPVAQTYEVFEN